jgi:ADP-ribosylglycohydrolase
MTDASALARARRAFEGLSVGDAFGNEVFLALAAGEAIISTRTLPPAPWGTSDDTEQAHAVLEVLTRHGHLDQAALACKLAERYWARPDVGYGLHASKVLRAIHRGVPWREASRAVFGGAGSMGNGAAMRSAVVGAYFADDLRSVIEQSRAAAEVTHAHPEGQAGAIAVALAAAWSWCNRERDGQSRGAELLAFVAAHTPKGVTRSGIVKATGIHAEASLVRAVSALGNGTEVTAPDTVPFALWCAARHLEDYAEVLWATASGLGDVDTNCAIVGGIVGLSASIPEKWLASLEQRNPAPALSVPE